MRQQHNQNVDQKKGSADRDVTGSKKGMPGGDIGRSSMGSSQGSSASYGGYESSYGSSASSASRSNSGSRSSATGKSDHGGPEGNSRERKTSRSGSVSNDS